MRRPHLLACITIQRHNRPFDTDEYKFRGFHKSFFSLILPLVPSFRWSLAWATKPIQS
jgi:hypothetical protein